MIDSLKMDTLIVGDDIATMELYDLSIIPCMDNTPYSIRVIDPATEYQYYLACYSNKDFALKDYNDLLELAKNGIKFWNEKY